MHLTRISSCAGFIACSMQKQQTICLVALILRLKIRAIVCACMNRSCRGEIFHTEYWIVIACGYSENFSKIFLCRIRTCSVFLTITWILINYLLQTTIGLKLLIFFSTVHFLLQFKKIYASTSVHVHLNILENRIILLTCCIFVF